MTTLAGDTLCVKILSIMLWCVTHNITLVSDQKSCYMAQSSQSAAVLKEKLTCSCSAENRARLAENRMCSQQVITPVDQSPGFAVYK